MLSAEITKAADALVLWFESQDLTPVDAMEVMTFLIVQLLTTRENSHGERQEVINIYRELLDITKGTRRA